MRDEFFVWSATNNKIRKEKPKGHGDNFAEKSCVYILDIRQ